MLSKTTKKVLAFVMAAAMVVGLVQFAGTQKAFADLVVGNDGVIKINCGSTGSENPYSADPLYFKSVPGWNSDAGIRTGPGADYACDYTELVTDLLDDPSVAAPLDVYNTMRFKDTWSGGGGSVFTISDLAEPLYTVRLHFALDNVNDETEDAMCAAIFNLDINGETDSIAYKNYKGLVDFANHPGAVYALVKDYEAISTINNKITVTVYNTMRSSISGIELIPYQAQGGVISLSGSALTVDGLSLADIDIDSLGGSYTAADYAETVVVSNVGTEDVEDLTISISGDDAACFVLSDAAISLIEIGNNESFDVSPASGLSYGNYSATVTISNGTLNASFDVYLRVGISSVVYMGNDWQTKGAWNGNYGAEGYILFGYNAVPDSTEPTTVALKTYDEAVLPSYVDSYDVNFGGYGVYVYPGYQNDNANVLDIPYGNTTIENKVFAMVGRDGIYSPDRVYTFNINDHEEHLFTIYYNSTVGGMVYYSAFEFIDPDGKQIAYKPSGVNWWGAGDIPLYITFKVRGSFTLKLNDTQGLTSLPGIFFGEGVELPPSPTPDPTQIPGPTGSPEPSADPTNEPTPPPAKNVEFYSFYGYKAAADLMTFSSGYKFPANGERVTSYEKIATGDWEGKFGGDGYILFGYKAVPSAVNDEILRKRANYTWNDNIGENGGWEWYLDDVSEIPAYLGDLDLSGNNHWSLNNPYKVESGDNDFQRIAAPGNWDAASNPYVLNAPIGSGLNKVQAAVGVYNEHLTDETFTFDFTDGQEHIITFYIQDWSENRDMSEPGINFYNTWDSYGNHWPNQGEQIIEKPSGAYSEYAPGDSHEGWPIVATGAYWGDFRHGYLSFKVTNKFSMTFKTGQALQVAGVFFDTVSEFNIADINEDGLVDSADLSEILENYGATGSFMANDLNYDNQIDANDLAILVDNYGREE